MTDTIPAGTIVIQVKGIIGKAAIDRQSGKNLFNHIFTPLTEGRPVYLNFRGIGPVSTVFINAAFGDLLAYFNREQVESLLTFENLNDLGWKLYGRVMRHAERYYPNPEYQERVDQARAERAEED
ncbi:MAG: STAS-like domain-containing protein [Candidatus Bipolaricaulia bacterium]